MKSSLKLVKEMSQESINSECRWKSERRNVVLEEPSVRRTPDPLLSGEKDGAEKVA